MNEPSITAETLAGLLREAETAHAEYERGLGHPDADWPTWYARYIVQRLPGADGAEESAEPYIAG